jgi:hypothetical protein
MPIVEKYLLGSQATLLSTELNSLANNCTVLGSAYDNTVGQTSDGYTLCDVQLSITFGSSPTPNTGISLWFLLSEDGTIYETYDTSQNATPSTSMPIMKLPVVFGVLPNTSAQIITKQVSLPWGKFKPLLKNDGTGVAFPATGTTVKIRPVTRQGV